MGRDKTKWSRARAQRWAREIEAKLDGDPGALDLVARVVSEVASRSRVVQFD